MPMEAWLRSAQGKSMFGKRTTPVPAKPRTASADVEKAAGSILSTIIVPRSAVEQSKDSESAYKLVTAVVKYVNALTGQGLYNRLEIPAHAIQAYHADYYLAQVNNGGHSQFIHNSGGNLQHCLEDVPAALCAMSAEAHQAIFAQLTAWVKQFPDPAALRAALSSDKAVPLQGLDRSFYEAEKTSPMSVLSARWILSWSDLKVVADGEYPEAIRHIALMNPLREQRLLWRAVQKLEHAMTDRLQVALGMACIGIRRRDGSTECLQKIGYGSGMMIDGKQERVWHVATNKGQRLCIVDDNQVSAYECIQPENPTMPKFGDVQGMQQAIKDGRLRQFKGPSIGAKLSQVPMKAIVEVIELARSYNAAAALDLLLRRAAAVSSDATVVPTRIEHGPIGTVGHWLVVAGQRAFMMECGPKGSALVSLADNQCAATVHKSEIDEHACKADAGRFAVT